MANKLPIAAMTVENQVVEGYFALWQIDKRDRKGGGKSFLALTLADHSGTIEAKMWDNIDEPLAVCTVGAAVAVKAKTECYQGKWQLCVEKIRLVDDRDAARFDPRDLRPASPSGVSIEAMDAELRGIVAGFRDPHLQRLVLAFLDDPELGPAFREAPAAKALHHAWIGGLLEHVLQLVKLALALHPFYPEVDLDLVVTGAILHDIGKVRELEWKTNFTYTLRGQLIGHISIAQGWLREKARALATPEPLVLLVEHMILSHHGRLEFGSPKLPMTPEAMLLSALDDLEAKFAAMRREFAAARAGNKPADATTDWIRSMERYLFDSPHYLRHVRGQEPPAVVTQESLFGDQPALEEDAQTVGTI